jgi:hypothetical protein
MPPLGSIETTEGEHSGTFYGFAVLNEENPVWEVYLVMDGSLMRVNYQ